MKTHPFKSLLTNFNAHVQTHQTFFYHVMTRILETLEKWPLIRMSKILVMKDICTTLELLP